MDERTNGWMNRQQILIVVILWWTTSPTSVTGELPTWIILRKSRLIPREPLVVCTEQASRGVSGPLLLSGSKPTVLNLHT